MKLSAHMKKGFTLIELVVVIAILGVLAAVLITVIDPLDKINSANDSGVISAMIQVGKGNDSFASNNNNVYPQATTFAALVTALNTAGEIKFSTLTAPTNYTYNYVATATCGTTATTCTSYVLYVNLKSKKYVTGANPSYYVYANGQGCTKLNQSSAPTIATTCP